MSENHTAPALPADLVDLYARARAMGIDDAHVLPYGTDVAKIDLAALNAPGSKADKARYVVVTAITPTPFGEGKTTTAIGLTQALTQRNKTSILTLRQSSMGPTFGIKGGAAGNGASQVLPAERMNLHLTGDFHAIAAAHNLLSAVIDNHLHHGNTLNIDESTITWPRVLDVNDRALRHIVTGLGGKVDGVTRQASFDITAASEIMVIMSLATSLKDLRKRIGNIVIGRNYDGDFITAEQLGAAGAMTVILRDALAPNLLRTTEGTPVLVHTGPFGNIATGCSSIIGDLMAARSGGYVLTEAGFGADMGAERFFNLKCVESGMRPHAAVLVVTVRALKAHSGNYELRAGKDLPEEMLQENVDDVRAGAVNLLKHLDIVRGFGMEPVVAINVFPTDHTSEIAEVEKIAREAGARVAQARPVTEGGAGCLELADAVIEACEAAQGSSPARPLYEAGQSLREKIEAVATMYGAEGADYTPAAAKRLDAYEKAGFGNLKVVVAKTPLSLSADPSIKGAPTGFRLPVREVRLAAGAGYVYAICGNLSTMPGLPSHPAAERIDLDIETGEIQGLR
ncbi:formate--tetrahydrofolate ligase [Actinomyces vulturis]|uniref:formate--tetrahydrofolate ligase n=1 Tax=Actinomyces vulturis TaxID=1857645 RepID=UPI000834451E|nr:formate--tetrahydrofolate ligase [Actinomyces vulturis]